LGTILPKALSPQGERVRRYDCEASCKEAISSSVLALSRAILVIAPSVIARPKAVAIWFAYPLPVPPVIAKNRVCKGSAKSQWFSGMPNPY
jgi:hypothetical protein